MIWLLFIFGIKHILADRIMRFPYEAKGKYLDKGWESPLLIHSLIHGSLTFVVVAAYSINPEIGLIYGAIDTVTHFIIDRIKVIENKKDKIGPDLLILMDQTAHIIVYIIMISVLINK